MIVPSAAPGLGQGDRRGGAEHVAPVHRLLERLRLDLVEERRRLDLGHEGEDRVGTAAGQLGDLSREVGLIRLHLDVELDLDARLVERLAIRLATAGAEFVVLVDEVDRGDALVDDEADELVGCRVDAERHPVDEVVVAVLLPVGDGRSLGTDEHRDLGTLCLDHVDDRVRREHGAQEDVGIALGHVGDDLLGHVGIGLGVLELDDDLTAEDAAGLVDLGDGHLDPEAPVLAGRLVGFVRGGDRDRVAVGTSAAAGGCGARDGGCCYPSNRREQCERRYQHEWPRPARNLGHANLPLLPAWRATVCRRSRSVPQLNIVF